MGAGGSREKTQQPTLTAGPGPPARPAVPKLLDRHGHAHSPSSLLDTAALELLAPRVPREHRQAWRLLYRAADHGQSFNRFLKHVCDQGPTMVVVRDADGNVFGGHAPDSWHVAPTFYGGYGTFIFNLTPEPRVHLPSGYNQNFLYLNEGRAQLPNGCAFGGQIENGFFGLWLHEDFETGHSSGPCMSFQGGVFDEPRTFKVDALEVWALAQLPDDDKDAEEGQESSTVLQRRREDANFMAMAGRELHSDVL